MRAVIPFDTRDPKSRLSPVLEPEERESFAEAMLADVLAALEPGDLDPEVVATTDPDFLVPAPVTVDERPLDAVVDAAIEAGTPVAVVMADLPLIGPAHITKLRNTPGDVVFAPGRGGGTNAMIVRDDAFHVDYHGVSIQDHRDIAHEAGLTVGEVDSFRFATDIDDPEDLVEVLVHGSRRAANWLREAGFEVTVVDGEPRISRD